ncbi:MAG: MFS transporter [Chlamydiota bacterium]
MAGACNSASFYMLTTLIPLFLIDPISQGGFGMSPEKSLQYYGTFFGFSFISPLLGGMVSDFKVGKPGVLLIGSFSMLIGISVLYFAPNHLWYGLMLIALGNGFNRNGLTASVGEITQKSDNRKAYRYFNLCTTSGFITASLVGGYLYTYYNFNLILKLISLLLATTALAALSLKQQKRESLDPSASDNYNAQFSGKKRTFAAILLMSAPFFIFFVQLMTSMNYFIHDNISRMVGSFEIPTVWINASGSILLLALNPLITSRLQHDHQPFYSELTTSRNVMALTSIAFLLMMLSVYISKDANYSYVALGLTIIPFFLFACSDTLLIRPQIFSAPHRYIAPTYRATATGLSFITMAVSIKFGSYLAAYSYKWGFFTFFAILGLSSFTFCTLLSLIKLKNTIMRPSLAQRYR